MLPQYTQDWTTKLIQLSSFSGFQGVQDTIVQVSSGSKAIYALLFYENIKLQAT